MTSQEAPSQGNLGGGVIEVSRGSAEMSRELPRSSSLLTEINKNNGGDNDKKDPPKPPMPLFS
jgi:hypothetical protein